MLRLGWCLHYHIQGSCHLNVALPCGLALSASLRDPCVSKPGTGMARDQAHLVVWFVTGRARSNCFTLGTKRAFGWLRGEVWYARWLLGMCPFPQNISKDRRSLAVVNCGFEIFKCLQCFFITFHLHLLPLITSLDLKRPLPRDRPCLAAVSSGVVKLNS